LRHGTEHDFLRFVQCPCAPGKVIKPETLARLTIVSALAVCHCPTAADLCNVGPMNRGRGSHIADLAPAFGSQALGRLFRVKVTPKMPLSMTFMTLEQQ
jgi:hypothetical protein